MQTPQLETADIELICRSFTVTHITTTKESLYVNNWRRANFILLIKPTEHCAYLSDFLVGFVRGWNWSELILTIVIRRRWILQPIRVLPEIL